MAELGQESVYIAGVAEAPLGEVYDLTEYAMAALAAREALSEAGMSLKDVDGVFVNYMGEEGSVQFAEYLGILPRYSDSTDLGGAAFEAFVHHAMVAISQHRCEVALVAYASRQRTRRTRSVLDSAVADTYGLTAQFQTPYGLPMPIGHYALIAARHIYEYGTTEAQMAEVAVAAREWARLNPKAWSRDVLSIEDVLSSRPIAEPIKRRDVCLVTDGGGALVITSGRRARDAAKKAIRVIGAGESHDHWHISQMEDLTSSAGRTSAREALGMAGIAPADVDFVEPYDSFTITPIIAFEDIGFCAKGEGGPFVGDGRLRPGGDLPSLTTGGGLSYCHPGALGILLLVEAVRQLRGECGARQVPNASIGIAHGVGGMFSTAGTVVLARD